MTEDEARTLLLSIDPLAALAEGQEQLRQRLQEIVPAVPDDLRRAWEAAARAAIEDAPAARPKQPEPTEQYAVLIPCRDEAQQVDLLLLDP